MADNFGDLSLNESGSSSSGQGKVSTDYEKGAKPFIMAPGATIKRSRMAPVKLFDVGSDIPLRPSEARNRHPCAVAGCNKTVNTAGSKCLQHRQATCPVDGCHKTVPAIGQKCPFHSQPTCAEEGCGVPVVRAGGLCTKHMKPLCAELVCTHKYLSHLHTQVSLASISVFL